MMTVTDSLSAIRNRDDFVSFLQRLLCDLKEQPDTWEHADLPSFLEALAAWIEDMDGYFQHQGIAAPDQPTWRLLAEMLLAARVYE